MLVATYILLLIAAAAIFIFGCTKQRRSPHVKIQRWPEQLSTYESPNFSYDKETQTITILKTGMYSYGFAAKELKAGMVIPFPQGKE